jgi:hypothetical protein
MKSIEYLAGIFYALMQSQPRGTFYTTSFWVAESIIRLDKKDKASKGESIDDNIRHGERLKFIRENTHEFLLLPLAIVEATVSATPPEHWRRPYDGKNNKGERIVIKNKTGGYETTVLDLYRLMKESYREAVLAVADTIQPYSMDYRVSANNGDIPGWIGGEND